MQIVVDENIPYADSAFSALGDVRVMAGRDISAARLADVDTLIVRSVTKVNAALLDGTAVRFVATATIGTDHVDEAYLRRRGIGFASAPGSNANSVAEYIVAALLVLSLRRGESLEDKTIGVVGCGNAGSRVAAKAAALGMRVLCNDPPLLRQTGSPLYLPLERLLDADFLTFHVPLTRKGSDATYHMVDGEFLRRLKPRATLLNSSRGAVVETASVAKALEAGALAAAVLDVWESEPDIDFDLVHRAAVATPHIAGYSFDGKLNGTDMVYRAACRFFGVEPTWNPEDLSPPTPVPRLEVLASGRTDEAVLHEAVKALYDIEADDADLRAAAALSPADRGRRFDELRKTYPTRREFHHTTIVPRGASAALMAKLRGLGFQVQPARPCA